MVASPRPEYARKLGEAAYQMAGLEWLVIKVIRRLDPSISIELIAGMTSRGIAEQLTSKVDRADGIDPARLHESKEAAQGVRRTAPHEERRGTCTSRNN